MVEFENYRGPAFNETQPLCVPIYSITVISQTEICLHERQQLPLEAIFHFNRIVVKHGVFYCVHIISSTWVSMKQ